MNENKKLTVMNWLLSILGIIVLSLIIILPPVFRKMLPKQEVVVPPKEEVIIGTTICSNPKVDSTEYTDDVIFNFTYQNQKLESYTRGIKRTYLDPLVYQEEKAIYGKYVTAFSIISGYEYSATPDDDSASVQIQEKFNLKVFKPTTITIPNDENPTAITTTYEYHTDIETIKSNLMMEGYTCVDNK